MGLGWNEAGARRVGTGLLFQISLVNSPKWAGMVNLTARQCHCIVRGRQQGELRQGQCWDRGLLWTGLAPRLGLRCGQWSISHRAIRAKAPTHSTMLTEHLPCPRPCSRCWQFSQGLNRPNQILLSLSLPARGEKRINKMVNEILIFRMLETQQ